VLLDTHILLWLVRGALLSSEALTSIADAQNAGALYVSAMTAWELGTAELKRTGRPELGMPPSTWFRRAMGLTGARLAPITVAVATEATLVPAVYGRGDPGDCFLIATARVRQLRLATRDAAMIDLANNRPDYLSVIHS